jgi:molecular chaperone DnaJ
MPGSGEVGPAGGPNGDLYLEMTVAHHDVFSREGDDLLATLDVSMPDAILGATTTIESLDGPVDLEIRPGVQAGDVLTIKGRGITPLRGTQRGDLRVGVHVVTPTRLDAKERALIEDFKKKTKSPAPKLAEFQQGLFARLRDRFRNS